MNKLSHLRGLAQRLAHDIFSINAVVVTIVIVIKRASGLTSRSELHLEL